MKTVRNLAAVMLLAVPLVVRAERPGPQVALEDREELRELIKLKAEISLLNLLNGLYLSESQLDRLVSLGASAQKLQQENAQKLAARSEEYRRPLMALRDELYGTTGAGPDTKRRARHAEVEIEKKTQDRMLDQVGDLEQQARAVLTEAQLAIIEQFKPCLIPPKNLADPVAVGQASTTELEEILVDLIRRMPESLYRKRRELIAETIVSRGEREKGKIPEDVRTGMVSAFLTKMDSIRSMSDVDLALRMKEIARSFQLFDDDVTYRKGHRRELGKVARLFFTPQAVEILKKWRTARGEDLPQTAVASTGGSPDPAKRKQKIESRVAGRYQWLVGTLIRERAQKGSLKGKQLADTRRAMAEAHKLKENEEKFQALSKIVDELNAIEITRASVSTTTIRAIALAHEKRVPVPGPGRKGIFHKIPDVTGIIGELKAAREHEEAGRFQEAYNGLSRVANILEQFSD